MPETLRESRNLLSAALTDHGIARPRRCGRRRALAAGGAPAQAPDLDDTAPIVAQWPLARLRAFTPDGWPADMVATLVLPSQAGHDSCIVDFAAGQSQIETILDACLTRVASLDWIGVTQQTKDASIESYLDVIEQSVERLGGRVNLVGDCQGGWLAAIYAALHPGQVNTLAVGGAAIDTKAARPQLQEWTSLLRPLRERGMYEKLVALNGGLWLGRYQLAGFKAMEPASEFARMAELLGHAHDGEALRRYAKFEDWRSSPPTFSSTIVPSAAGSMVARGPVGGRPAVRRPGDLLPRRARQGRHHPPGVP
jgi:pimeloyl-ACP methyl ester carboxylesterase